MFILTLVAYNSDLEAVWLRVLKSTTLQSVTYQRMTVFSLPLCADNQVWGSTWGSWNVWDCTGNSSQEVVPPGEKPKSGMILCRRWCKCHQTFPFYALPLSSHKAGVFILVLLANERPCHCLAVVNRMGSVILAERLELRGLHKLGECESWKLVPREAEVSCVCLFFFFCIKRQMHISCCVNSYPFFYLNRETRQSPHRNLLQQYGTHASISYIHLDVSLEKNINQWCNNFHIVKEYSERDQVVVKISSNVSSLV